MAEPMTCGEGLAANATLPAKLGELTAALADVLGSHTAALDLEDANARRERDAYVSLVERLRGTAGRLRAIADEMAGYRDLPAAVHDADVLASPELAAPFERFVAVEQELLALLESRVAQDRAMLGESGDA